MNNIDLQAELARNASDKQLINAEFVAGAGYAQALSPSVNI